MPRVSIRVPAGLLGLGSILLILVLVVACTVSFATGHSSRDYLALPLNTVVTIAGEPFMLEQLAYKIKPLLFQAPGQNSPPAMEMWWEAIDAGDTVALVYHPVWQDERHPILVLHWPTQFTGSLYMAHPFEISSTSK
jgi:hypothetical protein